MEKPNSPKFRIDFEPIKSAEETVKNPVLSEPKASSADLGFGAPIFRSEKSQRRRFFGSFLFAGEKK